LWEAVVIEVYLLAAVALIGVGAVLGFLALVSLGIRREGTAHSMTTPTSDPIARGARVASGVGTRTPGIVQEHRLDRPGLRPEAEEDEEQER
jgi:hypothetical protein